MAKNIDISHPTADAVLRDHLGRLQELINSLYVIDIVGGSGSSSSRTANGAVVGDTLLAVLAPGNTVSAASAPNTGFATPQVVATINVVSQTSGNFTGAPLVGVLMKTNV